MKKSKWGVIVASATEKNIYADLQSIGKFIWETNKLSFASKKEAEIKANCLNNSMWLYESKRVPENMLNEFSEIEF